MREVKFEGLVDGFGGGSGSSSNEGIRALMYTGRVGDIEEHAKALLVWPSSPSTWVFLLTSKRTRLRVPRRYSSPK